MKSSKLTPLFIVLMVFTSSSHSQLEESYPQQFPFLAVLDSSTQRCGGALISQSAILTVSHCLLASSAIDITLGASDLTHPHQFERGRIRFQVNSRAFRYDPNGGLFAVIRFTPLAMLNSFVNIVSIPFSSTDENFANITAVAMGFLRQPENYDSLHFISVSTLNNATSCAANQVNNQNDLICVGASAVCNLNIGSPMVITTDFHQNVLIGLLFSPDDECNERQPTGFARVTNSLHFIRQNMI